MSAKKILIIDDEAEVLDFLKEFLERKEMLVQVLPDGQGALERIEKFRPDALFLDLSMKIVGGLQVLEAIHRKKLPVKVIIMTAEKSPALLEQTLRLGASGYLAKPFRLEELESEIEKAFGSE